MEQAYPECFGPNRGLPAHRSARLREDGPMRALRLTSQRIIAVIYVVAMFMTIMDATIVYVALPAIARSFAVSPAATDGVVVGYLVSLAVWIPASGWVGDRFGTKRTFLAAISLFTVASVLCGLSQSVLELVLFRVLQGAGGGMLTPVGMAMLYRAFPPAQRARLARILVIPTVMAPALGPLVGGALVDNLSWRWVFFVNVPIGIAALIFSALMLTEHRERAGERFDMPGFVLAAAGFGVFLFALSEAATLGWTSPVIVVAAVAGAALIAALVWVELHADQPMIDFRLLGSRLFGLANLTSLFASAGFLGLLFAAPIWLQTGRGLSAFVSGSSTAPEALGVLVSSQLVGRLYPRIGPRRLVSGGLIGVTVATLLLAVLMDGNLWLFRAVMFAIGVGWAYVVISMNAGAFAQVSPRDTGRAAALYNAQRQLASAVGVAALATIIGSQTSATSFAGNITVFRLAFFAAAALTFTGALIALAIRDRDAASTMRRASAAQIPAVPVA
jgi:EmrB/QacA subfamily drug resistance transporter